MSQTSVLAEQDRKTPPETDAGAGFELRMQAHSDRLKGALDTVYGDRNDFAAWLERLFSVMSDAALARPAHLVALDGERLAAPDWLLQSDAIGYSAYVERFGGDLKGLIERIPYLKRLGVRYLHLLPFWKAREGDNDGGFAVSDFLAVREDVGDIDDLITLAKALSDAGIALCGDLVLNHTADDHPWALAARAGDPTARGYYHLVSATEDVVDWEAGLTEVFPETAPGNFTWNDQIGAYVWTTFYPFQWDLNWSNPDVFLKMAKVVLDLANMGVEVFRLDSAAYLWKRRGTLCKGEPESHLLLQALRAVCDIVAPAIRLKAEVIAPVSETVAFLGGPQAPECHLAYHAGLMTAGWASLAEGDADLARRVLRDAPPPPTGAGWVTYVRCHDDIGWMTLKPQIDQSPQRAAGRLEAISAHYTSGKTYARGETFQTGSGVGVHGLNGMAASLLGFDTDDALALDRLSLLYGLAFAAGGMPLIFMGDELGQSNDQSWRDDPLRAHEGRWLHRPMFDADAANIDGERAKAVLGAFARLRTTRSRLPALSPDTAPRVHDGLPEAILGFTRGEQILCLFNFSETRVKADLPGDGQWRDLLTGADHSARIDIAPLGMAWLKAEAV